MEIIDRGDALTIYCDGLARIVQIGGKLDFVFYVETLEDGRIIRQVNLHMFRPPTSLLMASDMVNLVEQVTPQRRLSA